MRKQRENKENVALENVGVCVMGKGKSRGSMFQQSSSTKSQNLGKEKASLLKGRKRNSRCIR